MSTETENKIADPTAALAEASLLDDILAESKIRKSDEGYDVAKKGVAAFIAELLAPGKSAEKVDKSAVDAMIAELDRRLSSQVLSIAKDDLLADFEDAPEITKSGLYRLVYSNEYGVSAVSPTACSAATTSSAPARRTSTCSGSAPPSRPCRTRRSSRTPARSSSARRRSSRCRTSRI